jgi:uncharacterized protein (TIGR02466 family)
MVCDGIQFLDIAKEFFGKFDFNNCDTKIGYGGKTTYYSGDEFPVVDKAQEFYDALILAATAFAQQQGVDVNNHRIVISEIWMSRLGEGDSHIKHAHPNSHFAGTYYVTAPEGAACLRIHNPAADMWGFAMPPIEVDGMPATSMYVDHAPSPGKLLIWNSWLYHEVLQNASVEPRNAISFNFVCLKR